MTLGTHGGEGQDLPETLQRRLLVDDAPALSRHARDREECVGYGGFAVARGCGETLDRDHSVGPLFFG
jgi:hypothetical protein